MTRVTALLSATALTFAFATPASACGMNKSAEHKTQTIAEIVVDDEMTSEDAMTTFDPATKPVFEEQVEGSVTLEEEAAE